MKTKLLLASFLVSTTTFAANFGGASASPASTAGGASTPPAASPAVIPTAASGPQVADVFKVVKPDGTTVIQQGSMNANAGSASVLTLLEADAIAKGAGKCGYNIKYDEISSSAAVNTTNRLFSNDKAIAINSKIDLAAGVLKTIWTQPYLFSGMNNVRVVVNADGAAPSTKWIRINVIGNCGAAPAATPPASTPPAATPPSSTPPAATPPTAKPPVTPTPPVTVNYAPGSAEWNNLNIVYGYSNYAKTQLKDKGYSRYDALVKLNDAVTTAFNAKSVERSAYNSMMTSWNTFVTDPVFISMMKAIVPGSTGK